MPEEFNPNPHPPAGSVSHNAPAPAVDGQTTFDASYVHELREEAARYRNEFKPFRDAFDGYGDEEKAEWFDLAKTLRENPAAAAERFRQLADELSPQQAQAAAAWTEKTASTDPAEVRRQAQAESNQAAPAPTDGDRPLTVAEYRAMQQADEQARQQQWQAQQQEVQVQDIYKQAQALGYESNTKEIVDLFWTAKNQTNGDLAAAHQALVSQRESIIRDYLAQKSAGAAGLPVPSRGGVAASTATEIKDFSTARASLEARLNAIG